MEKWGSIGRKSTNRVKKKTSHEISHPSLNYDILYTKKRTIKQGEEAWGKGGKLVKENGQKRKRDDNLGRLGGGEFCKAPPQWETVFRP